MRFLIIFILVLSSIILVVLSVIAFNKKKAVGTSAIYLGCCLAAIAIYSFCYSMELSSNSLGAIMFWVRLEHLGIQFLTPFWFLFTLYQTGHEKWMNKSRMVLLFILPVLFFLEAQTLGSLNLLHANPRVNLVGPFHIFDYDRTIWMILSVANISVLLISSTVMFTVLLFGLSSVFRGQTMIFWLGSILPWMSGVVYTLGFFPYNLDPTPFACIMTGILLSIGFFRLNVLTIIPLARNVIFEAMRDGVLVLNTNGQIIDFNKRITNIFPSINRDSIGKMAIDEFNGYSLMKNMLEDHQLDNIEISMIQGDNTEYYQVKRSELRNYSNKPVGDVITFYLYTEIKELLGQLEELATHDGLTGVNNRRYFLQLAEQELLRVQRYGGCFSVIICDLDFFKSINDEYGHLIGDEILIKVANTCLSALRKTDIFGRFGGEEFVFLLPETNLTDGELMAERVRKAVEGITFDELQLDTHVTASFGVVCLGEQESDRLEDLLRYADQALYRAKATGRNKVCAFQLGIKPEQQ
ncbi:MAG: diguanylate cyclase [Flexilinea sp.]